MNLMQRPIQTSPGEWGFPESSSFPIMFPLTLPHGKLKLNNNRFLILKQKVVGEKESERKVVNMVRYEAGSPVEGEFVEETSPPVDLTTTGSQGTRILAKEILEPTLGVTDEGWIREFKIPTASSPVPAPDSAPEVDSVPVMERAISPGLEPSYWVGGNWP